MGPMMLLSTVSLHLEPYRGTPKVPREVSSQIASVVGGTLSVDKGCFGVA